MPQPALAWNAVMKLREMPQEGEMVFAPGDDVIEIVAGGDRGTGHQQQDLLERIHNAPGLAVILELGKMPQKQGKTRTRDLLVEDLVHDGAPANQERPRNHTASSTQNHSGQAVNLASEPWCTVEATLWSVHCRVYIVERRENIWRVESCPSPLPCGRRWLRSRLTWRRM